MTAFDVNSLNTFGGALNDYGQGPIDPTTDRPAAGANPAYAQTAAMSHTAGRVMARLTLNGTSAPTLTTHDEMWNNGNTGNNPPTPARTGVGVLTLTYPAVVTDEIPAGLPGYSTTGYAVNLRAAHGQAEGSVFYNVQAAAQSPNVVTIWVYTSGGVLTDLTGVVISVFAS